MSEIVQARGIIEFDVRAAEKIGYVAMRFRFAHREPGMEGDWSSWVTIDPEGAEKLAEAIHGVVRGLRAT